MEESGSFTDELRARGSEGAEKAIDPEWGLDTDHRAVDSLEVARDWAESYRKLLSYDTSALNYMREPIEELPPSVRREIEETNIPIMDAQIERVRVRLAYWEARERELQDKLR